MNGKLSSLRGKAATLSADKINELTALNWNCSILKKQGPNLVFTHVITYMQA
jgi:hypothetical protein